MNFGGEWSQPGGDKKIFTFGKSSISWRKSKSILHFEGEESTTIKKRICEVMLDKEISSQQQVHSSLLPVIACDEIESLRTGQPINTEAIQSLAESVATISSIVNEFKTISESKATAESQTSMGEISLSETLTEFEYEQKAGIGANENSFIHLTNNNTQSSYAKATKAHFSNIKNGKAHLGSSNTSEKLTKKPDDSIISQVDQPNEDGFVGVKRRRRRYRKCFLSGIADNVKESQIYSYLYKRNISPSHISVFQIDIKERYQLKSTFR